MQDYVFSGTASSGVHHQKLDRVLLGRVALSLWRLVQFVTQQSWDLLLSVSPTKTSAHIALFLVLPLSSQSSLGWSRNPFGNRQAVFCGESFISHTGLHQLKLLDLAFVCAVCLRNVIFFFVQEVCELFLCHDSFVTEASLSTGWTFAFIDIF